MAAARRISSLLSRPVTSASSLLLSKWVHLNPILVRGNCTSVQVKDPITPDAEVTLYTGLFIDGQFSHSHTGQTFETMDPRNGKVIANVAEGGPEDIDHAVHAAGAAFGKWQAKSAYERSKILLNFADLIEENKDLLAKLETMNSGKLYERVKNFEVPMTARLMRYYAVWADKIHSLGLHHVQTFRQPFGVVGQIIPWNFPLLMFACNVGPALACGNTVVLKTAKQTPLSALYAAQLLQGAGIPKGVINVISGSDNTIEALAKHDKVDKLAFTGSTKTSNIVLEAAKKNNKPVTVEIGGKSTFIICEDADVDKAAKLVHEALFFNQGQWSCAGSRTYVHENVYDNFVKKAKEHAMNRKVDDPFKDHTQHGPQIDKNQLEKIVNYIQSVKTSGADLETGGNQIPVGMGGGYYIEPAVFSNVEDNMPIVDEEIFAPVQSILKYRDLDEVMRRSNATGYGRAAGSLHRRKTR